MQKLREKLLALWIKIILICRMVWEFLKTVFSLKK